MTNWKYTDSTNTIVWRELANGRQESCLASILPDGTNVLPADPILEPPPPVYSCSPWQIRKALNALGLRTAVESAVAASNDQALKDGWEFATSFISNDPFVIGMGEALGKTPEEIAAVIQHASTL